MDEYYYFTISTLLLKYILLSAVIFFRNKNAVHRNKRYDNKNNLHIGILNFSSVYYQLYLYNDNIPTNDLKFDLIHMCVWCTHRTSVLLFVDWCHWLIFTIYCFINLVNCPPSCCVAKTIFFHELWTPPNRSQRTI